MNIQTRIKTRDLTKMTLLTALLCISSYIIIPLPFSLASITAQTIIINLLAFLLKPKEAFIVVFLYLLLGLIGLPVFSGGTGGPGRLFGPTGGYLLGYLVAATVIAYLKGQYFNPKKCLFISIFIGMPLIYFFGASYMKMLTGMNLKSTILTSVIPFIPLDIFKCFLATILAKAINKFIY